MVRIFVFFVFFVLSDEALGVGFVALHVLLSGIVVVFLLCVVALV